MISHSSSKWVYRKFSWWCARHQAAISEPPRDTIPVTRLTASGMYRSSTPACTVM